MNTAIATILVLFLGAPAPIAKKTEIITLESGESFEGTVLNEKKGRLTVRTALGVRVVPSITVAVRRPARDVHERFEIVKQKSGKDLKAAVSRMKWARRNGLTSAMVAEMDAILEADPTHETTLGYLRAMAPHYRVAKPNRQPRDKPRWSRHEVDLLWKAARSARWAQAALVRFQLGALPRDDSSLNEAVDNVDSGSLSQRWIAAHVLRDYDSVRRVKPLYRRALGDPAWQVRSEAVASLKHRDDGTTIGPFVKALVVGKADATRVYAAEALAQLGDTRAVPALVHALRGAGSGRPTRNNVVVTRQTAYIKDFDVEIAQAAVIADPIVDTVTEGSVLDVGVVSVSQQRAVYTRSLRTLTGAKMGADPRAWSRWLKEHRADYE